MGHTANKVSINRIIGNVIGNLGLKSTNNIIDDFARWACEAESKIGSTSSYKRYECELTIKNKRAALPPNFVYLNALKYGNKIVPITNRSFRMFNKGNGTANVQFFNQKETYNNNQKQIDVPGVPLSLDIILGGAYAVGDLIVVTIVANDCGTIGNNVFNHIVEPGQSLTDIAQSLVDSINAIQGLGYKATPGNDKLNITGCSPDIGFTVSLFTDSVAGTIKNCIVQKRVPSRKNTPSNSGSMNTDPITKSHNLASSTVSKLNTGIHAQGSNSIGNGFNNRYDINPLEQAFSIDNGCINFNAYDDDKIGISYMGVDLDEDGWPLVSETHEDAVTHYIMYMYKGVQYYDGKLPNHVFKELQTRWFDLCGQARGDDELPDGEEMKYLANLWMQFIPLPSKENF